MHSTMSGLARKSAILLAICVLLFSCTANAFLAHNQRGKSVILAPRSKKQSSTQLKVLLAPQIAFAAACAWTVFNYVSNNIEEIKAKQEVAVKETMSKQAADINSAQEKQKQNIARIQEEQRQNILKAQKKVDDSRR